MKETRTGATGCFREIRSATLPLSILSLSLSLCVVGVFNTLQQVYHLPYFEVRRFSNFQLLTTALQSFIKMQKWVVICWALLALVGAEECPDGGRCNDGQTCCNDPANGYECCPFDQAECCEDHEHCCPAETTCDTATSSCVNATVSIPWTERASADQPRLSKSFRMIKAYMGEEDDNVCPDQSRCPPEFSCLRALTKYGCCPLAQAVSCSDGKHCCPEGHECSADSRSCIKKELVTAVLCSDEKSECPDGTTCCENPDGQWACCPMPQAVCCEDKLHCCPEGSTCDIEHFKCISSSTKKDMPMWAKLPARRRADWENQKEDDQVTAETVNTVPPPEREITTSSVAKAAAGDVPCDDTFSCQDNTTCCETTEGGWACCPLPEAVCCEDHIHCCPHGKKCNLAAQTCDDETCSVPWVTKIPAAPRQDVQVGGVTCDATFSCPDGTSCCKNKKGDWACCPLSQAVCCDDHEHCCPSGTTCDLTTLTCQSSSGSVPMVEKLPAFVTEAPTTVKASTEPVEEESDEPEEGEAGEGEGDDEEDQEEENQEEEEEQEEEGRVQCDPQTSCPQSSTCCFMKSAKRWGCCPLPDAVCCSDGDHCCPASYKCSDDETSCVKGEVVIPWYTKLPATTSFQLDPNTVQCDDAQQCPEHTTCCQLATGKWGCCPLENAVCCQDKKHCCPQGYTCNMATNSCQKLLMLQLESVPLTPVYPPMTQPQLVPSKHRDVKCDDTTSCEDGDTCCRTSATTWGCCPMPNAVCCPDMLHCCPTGYICTDTGECTQNPSLHWYNWHVFLANKKRALII